MGVKQVSRQKNDALRNVSTPSCISMGLFKKCKKLCDCLLRFDPVPHRSRPPTRRAISSVGRAPRLHRGCRRFESVIAHHFLRQQFCMQTLIDRALTHVLRWPNSFTCKHEFTFPEQPLTFWLKIWVSEAPPLTLPAAPDAKGQHIEEGTDHAKDRRHYLHHDCRPVAGGLRRASMQRLAGNVHYSVKCLT